MSNIPVPDRINIRDPKNHGIKYIYIGRISGKPKFHFGNPFTHLEGTLASVKVATQEMAVKECEKWLRGTAWLKLEQERRTWILENLNKLDGRTIGCFCEERTKWCHGNVLRQLRKEQLADQAIKPPEPPKPPELVQPVEMTILPKETKQLELFPPGTDFKKGKAKKKKGKGKTK